MIFSYVSSRRTLRHFFGSTAIASVLLMSLPHAGGADGLSVQDTLRLAQIERALEQQSTRLDDQLSALQKQIEDLQAQLGVANDAIERLTQGLSNTEDMVAQAREDANDAISKASDAVERVTSTEFQERLKKEVTEGLAATQQFQDDVERGIDTGVKKSQAEVEAFAKEMQEREARLREMLDEKRRELDAAIQSCEEDVKKGVRDALKIDTTQLLQTGGASAGQIVDVLGDNLKSSLSTCAKNAEDIVNDIVSGRVAKDQMREQAMAMAMTMMAAGQPWIAAILLVMALFDSGGGGGQGDGDGNEDGRNAGNGQQQGQDTGSNTATNGQTPRNEANSQSGQSGEASGNAGEAEGVEGNSGTGGSIVAGAVGNGCRILGGVGQLLSVEEQSGKRRQFVINWDAVEWDDTSSKFSYDDATRVSKVACNFDEKLLEIQATVAGGAARCFIVSAPSNDPETLLETPSRATQIALGGNYCKN